MLLAMINIGVYLTKGLIWAALPFYLLGWVLAGKAGVDASRLRRSRLWLTVGFGFYLWHVLMGFQNFYGWSHAAAYEVMALQTHDVFAPILDKLPLFLKSRARNGAAIYVNYFFTVLWAAEVLWAWARFEGWRQRSRWIARLLHGFMLVVWLCGMIAFSSGPVRWYSLALVAMAIGWRLIPGRAPNRQPDAG
jgi:hypothetical protein